MPTKNKYIIDNNRFNKAYKKKKNIGFKLIINKL